MTTRTLDEVVQLFAPLSDADTLLGKSNADAIKNKFNSTQLAKIYDDITKKQPQLIQADNDLNNLIGKLPAAMNASKPKFDKLMAELGKLQIYIFLSNCDQVKKQLADTQQELTDAKQNHQDTIKFIDDLIDALNNKLTILNPISYAQIGGNNGSQQRIYRHNLMDGQGSNKKNYFNKYIKYKTKYLALKKQFIDEY